MEKWSQKGVMREEVNMEQTGIKNRMTFVFLKNVMMRCMCSGTYTSKN